MSVDLMVPHVHFPPRAPHPQLLAVDLCVLLAPHPSPCSIVLRYSYSLCHLLFLLCQPLMEIKHREEFPWLHLFKRKTLFSASGLHCCPLLVAWAPG